jgi:hypothetical protein
MRTQFAVSKQQIFGCGRDVVGTFFVVETAFGAAYVDTGASGIALGQCLVIALAPHLMSRRSQNSQATAPRMIAVQIGRIM